MQNPKPPVLLNTPFSKPLRDPRELLRARMTTHNRRLRKARPDHPVRHQPTPVCALLRRAKAPRPRARRDVRPAEPRLERPSKQAAPALGVPAVRARNLEVQRAPRGYRLRFGVPDHAPDVRVAGGDEAAGPRDATHLAERRGGVVQVLEHLVRVHDVERGVWEGQRMRVAGDEADVVDAALSGDRARALEGLWRELEADDLSLGY